MRITPEKKNKKRLNESTGYVIRASLEIDDIEDAKEEVFSQYTWRKRTP